MSSIEDVYEDLIYEYVPGGLNSKPRIEKNYCAFNIPSSKRELRLTQNDLNQLYDKEFPEKRKLLHYKHCGFSYESYGEFLIDVEHPFLIHFGSTLERIPENVLTFKINEVLIKISPVSDLCKFLLQPLYHDSDFLPEGLSEFASVKITNCLNNEFKDYFLKGLFYLNSHYFKPTKMVVKLQHLASENEHETEEEIERLNSMDLDDVVGRSRTFTRNDFNSVEPLKLYSYALNQQDSDKFLAFYRIVEFFFNRFQEKKLNELRYDDHLSEKEILKQISLNRELEYIINMVNWALTDSMKSKLVDFAYHHSLIQSSNINVLSESLYEFRNSIVHAKESELDRTTIPDPFNVETQINKWIFIVRFIAERLIKELNEVNK